MRHSYTLAVLATLTLGAVAGPVKHDHFHAKKAVEVEVVKAEVEIVKRQAVDDGAFAAAHPDINFAEAYSVGMGLISSTAAAATTLATSVSAASAAGATPTSSTSGSSGSSSSTASNMAGTALSSLLSTAASMFSSSSIAYTALKGAVNVGSFGTATCTGSACSGGISSTGNMGSPYGSNMMMVDSVGSNQYTMEYINDSGSPMVVVIWNKAGEDGNDNSGQSSAASSPGLAFPLASGSSQIVAFQEGSNCGAAPVTAGTTLINSGAFDTTWMEFNFISDGPAYDVSSIANSAGNSYKMSMTNSVNQCVSSESENHWVSDSGTTDISGHSTGNTAQGCSASTADSTVSGGCCLAGASNINIVTTFNG